MNVGNLEQASQFAKQKLSKVFWTRIFVIGRPYIQDKIRKHLSGRQIHIQIPTSLAESNHNLSRDKSSTYGQWQGRMGRIKGQVWGRVKLGMDTPMRISPGEALEVR